MVRLNLIAATQGQQESQTRQQQQQQEHAVSQTRHHHGQPQQENGGNSNRHNNDKSGTKSNNNHTNNNSASNESNSSGNVATSSSVSYASSTSSLSSNISIGSTNERAVDGAVASVPPTVGIIMVVPQAPTAQLPSATYVHQHHLNQPQQNLHHVAHQQLQHQQQQQQHSPASVGVSSSEGSVSPPLQPPLLQTPSATSALGPPICAVHHPQQHQLAIVAAMHQAQLAAGGVLGPPPSQSPLNHVTTAHEHHQAANGVSAGAEGVSPSGSTGNSSNGGTGSGSSAASVVHQGPQQPPPGSLYIQYPGEFYPAEYYIAPHPHEGICPQHHHHHHQATLCAMPTDYGKKQKGEAPNQPPTTMFAQGSFYYCPTAVQMVSQNRPPPMPVQVAQGAQVMQPYLNESGTLTHMVLSPQQYQQMHPGQGHIHAPFLTTANGTSHFYSPLPGPTGYSGSGPTHYHAQQPPQQQQPTQSSQQPMTHAPHSPSPPSGAGAGGNSYHKDERSQRQHTKLLRKLEKQREFNSAMSTPAHSPSPRRNDVNGLHHVTHTAATTNNSSQAATSSAAAQQSAGLHNGGNNNNHNHVNHSNQPGGGMYHTSSANFVICNNNGGSNHGRRISQRSSNGAVPIPNSNFVAGEPSAADALTAVTTNSSSTVAAGLSALSVNEDNGVIDEEEEDYQVTIAEQLSLIQKPEVVDITSRSAKIVWEAPALTEPHLINMRELRYNVLLSDPAKQSKYKSLYKGESYDCIVQDLQPGQDYVVRVQVHYEKLQGSASEPTEFTTPACEPDQPLPPKLVNRTKNSLQLRWTSPLTNGAPILHYVLEYDSGPPNTRALLPSPSSSQPQQPLNFVEVVRTKSKQFSVNKLQPSTVYNFRLAAVNEVGPSLYSLICAHSTAGQPPVAPKPPTLQALSTSSLRLMWEKRQEGGNFVLQMQDREAACGPAAAGYIAKYNGPDCIYECGQLRRATAYQFRLCVENEDGRSPWSAEITYKTAPERPGRPGKPHTKGKIHGTYFRVRWDAPADTGGAEILRYCLEITSGSKFERIYSGADPETTCDHLQPGTTYQLRTMCEGVAGPSVYSEVAHITSEAIVPAAATPPQLDSGSPPGPYAAVLRLGKPDYNGGAPLLEFEVQLRVTSEEVTDEVASIVYRGKDSYCIVKDLRPGCTYEAQARAYNRIGAGPWSPWFRFNAAASPPHTPAAPKVVVKSPTHLCVSWLEPALNGAPITEYRLESASANFSSREDVVDSFTVKVPPSQPTMPGANTFQLCYQGAQQSADLRNLLPYTLYYFRLNARNVAGTSAWSPLVNAQTPAAVPAAPHIKDYEFTANEATLVWSQPATHGAPISAYTIEYGDQSISTPGNAREYTITGLAPETAYKFRIQAINFIGSGPFSTYAKLTTLQLPPCAPALECTGIGHNFIKLKWGDGRNLDFTKFYVEMYVQRAKEFQVVYAGTSCMCKVNKLQERTAYTFRICAGNDRAGVGDFSAEYYFSTTATLPSGIKAPRAGSICLLAGGVSAGGAIPSGALPETPTSFFAGLGQLSLGVPLLLEWQSSKNSFTDVVEYILQYAIGKDGDFKKIFRGAETKFTIENLEPGQLYQFRVCPVRVTTAGEDLPGSFTGTFRYQVPQLPTIDDFDSNLLNSAASVFGGCAAIGSGGPNTCHGHAHMHAHHSHHAHGAPPLPHSHHAHHAHHSGSSHTSRHNGPGAASTANLHGVRHRSVSASAISANNNTAVASSSSTCLGNAIGVHPATGTVRENANTLLLGPNATIGLLPLGPTMLSSEVVANFGAAGCDDPHHHHHHHHHPFHSGSGSETDHHLLPGQQQSSNGSNTSQQQQHSHPLQHHPLLATAATLAAAAVTSAAAAAASHNNYHQNANNQNAHNNGAIRRYVAKLTSVYTNRKRFSDQEKAVIFMVSFLFFTFLFATLVKMFMR